MSKFAMLGEEYFERRNELTDKEKELYELIMLHTFGDTGLSNKTIAEIIEIWGLDYNHTMGRYKVLRGEIREKLQSNAKFKVEAQYAKDKLKKRLEDMKSPWVIEEKHGYIRPLVGIVFNKSSWIAQSIREKFAKNKTSEFEAESFKTSNIEVETSNIEVSDIQKTPNIEVETSNIEVSYNKEYSEPLQSLENPTATPEAQTRRASANSNGHKSIFSEKECFRYAEICKERGEEVKTVVGLADWLYKTGEKDFLIQTTLYPEQQAEIKPHDTIVWKYDCEGNMIPQPMPLPLLEDALAGLVETRADGLDIDDFKKFYTSEDWQWLMRQLKK
jgi:hypothetical protein